MKKYVMLLCALLLVSCSNRGIEEAVANERKEVEPESELEQLRQPSQGELCASVITTIGDIKLRLFPEVAPNAVNNFVQLAKENHYDYLVFDRIEKDFLIQVQSHPLYPLGRSINGENYTDETDHDYVHLTGAVGMSKYTDYRTDVQYSPNDSFYIICQGGLEAAEMEAIDSDTSRYSEAVRNAYECRGGVPRLDGEYTVFAQVYEGLDFVQTINDSASEDANQLSLEPVMILDVVIFSYEEGDTP